MNQILEDWKRVPIKEIADVFLGKTPARTEYTSEGKYKIIKFRDLKQGYIDFDNTKDGFIAEQPLLIKSLRQLMEDDVLITSAAHSGENIGKKCAYVKKIPEKYKKIFFTGELLNLRALYNQTLAKWIYFYFLSPSGFVEIQNAVKGVHLTSGRAKSMQIDLAPPEEQRRIVAKLEKLLQKVDACEERLDKIPTILKRFRQSVLAAACSGRLTEDWREKHPNVRTSKEKLTLKSKDIYKRHLKDLPQPNELKNENLPKEWAYATLPYLVSNEKYSIKRGPFGSSLKKEFFVKAGYKVYEQQHVIRNDFTIGKYYIDEKKFFELKAFKVNPGDVLISCSGTIGRIVIVPQEIEEGIINQALLKLTMDNLVIIDEYFVYMFEDFVSKQEFLLNIKGNAITNIASINELKKILFPIPPIDEQHEIVRRIESLFKVADRIEERYTKARTYVDKLTQSILAKAFRGELVPQDPADEPASELLKRIKEEKAKNETKVKSAKRGKKSKAQA